MGTQNLSNVSNKEVIIKKPNQLMRLNDLQNQPKPEWLVENLIPEKSVGMIFGQSGSGKTFIVIDMIFAMCSQKKVANTFTVQRPLNVLYVPTEACTGVYSRFMAAQEYHKVDGDFVNLGIIQDGIQLFDEQSEYYVDKFIANLKAQGIESTDVIFIDTLHRSSNGVKENDNDDMRVVWSSCDKLVRALNCSVILVHHSNKANTGWRGAGSMGNDSSFIIEVEKTSKKGGGTFKCIKNQEGEEWPIKRFVRTKFGDSAVIKWDEDDSNSGADVYALEKALITNYLITNPNSTKAAIAAGAPINKNKIGAIIDEMYGNNLISLKLKNPDANESSSNPKLYFNVETKQHEY